MAASKSKRSKPGSPAKRPSKRAAKKPQATDSVPERPIEPWPREPMTTSAPDPGASFPASIPTPVPPDASPPVSPDDVPQHLGIVTGDTGRAVPSARRFDAFAGVSAAIAVLALALLIFNFTGPWFNVGGDPVYRSDLAKAENQSGYDRGIVWFPLLGLILLLVLAIAGVVEAFLALSPSRRAVVRGGLALAFLPFAFLTALSGFRLMGFFLMLAQSTNNVDLSLGPVPYANAGVGLAVCAAAGWVLWKTDTTATHEPTTVDANPWPYRVALASTGVAAFALAITPFVVMAIVKILTTDLHLSEAGFDPAKTSGDAGRVATDLMMLRVMFWIIGGLGLAAAFGHLAWRSQPRPSGSVTWAHLYALTIVPLIIAIVFASLFHVHLAAIEGESRMNFGSQSMVVSSVRVFHNFIPALGTALVLAAFCVYALKAVRPLLPRLLRPAPASADLGAPETATGEPVPRAP